MGEAPAKRAICGLWMSPEGEVHLSLEDGAGGRTEVSEPFRPFCWSDSAVVDAGLPPGVEVEELAGTGHFNRLLRFPSVQDFRETTSVKTDRGAFDVIRPMEAQFLIGTGERLFSGMHLGDLRRCQCDIETACCRPGGFSNARRAEDRVLAIGLRFGDRQELLTIDECDDEGERRLLQKFAGMLVQEDPDVIEGHNIFRFDLDFLRLRCRRLGLPCAWGRFGREAVFRPGRLKVAERWIDYPRCDIPGRSVFDTYLMVLLYDLATREMASYGLKEVALHLGISGDEAGLKRTYLRGKDIECAFHEDRRKFLSYLEDDLRETGAIADRLLPTYFAQASAFPMTLQDAALRGTSGKVDLLLLQEYYDAREALPVGAAVQGFEGGFTRSFETGVFKQVWHFDVASLYPSILLNLSRNPAGDSLGAFIPTLRRLREYRLHFKNLARQAPEEELRAEYQARQASYKILINSFYGYLGFGGARFADGELAARVTREGRELLKKLIEVFRAAGCCILEADTDGIYLTAPEGCDRPERLLKEVAPALPPGIDLEFDGQYLSMFCYKAKNYALFDGKRVILRGSALRSRGMEPFLQKLTNHLIRWLLGLEEQSPKERATEYRERIARQELEVAELARSENLSQNPDAYRRAIEAEPGRPRRSAMEAALRMKPLPRMGDRMTFYIVRPLGARSPDWQRARPVDQYNRDQAPYDAELYIRKLTDWQKRYEEFLEPQRERMVQGELF